MPGSRQKIAWWTALILAVCAWHPLLHAQAKPATHNAPNTNAPAAAQIQAGPYFALVIGNNHYKYLKSLQTPINDAQAMAQLLHDVFGFQTKVLLDADRTQIITALVEYRAQLRENSNLLIYYAGHGYHDRDTDEAYWLPVDAQPDNNANWISADDVTRDVRAMESAHILLISDSCYSGYMTRDAHVNIRPNERDAYVAKMLNSKSRNLMSSGGDEPVADAGAPGHSVFAWAVLESLRSMNENMFTAADVFERYIQPKVGGRSEQLPQYSWIRNSGHQAGDFVFYRHAGDSSAASAALASPAVASAATTSAPASPSADAATDRGQPGTSSAVALPEGMDPSLTGMYRKAQAGNPQAMYDLALAYHSGKGVTKSLEQAVYWYRKAAEAGSDHGMNDLGVCYENGSGVPIDYQQAVTWYRKAADDGLPLAMVNLGIMYQRGLGVPKDLNQAVAWFKKSAAAGNARGMWALGRMYKYGNGVTRDYPQALALFQKSGDAGDPMGWCALGTMYENGLGVTRDLGQAVGFYQKSADMGGECGKEQLKRRAENPQSRAP